MDDNNPLFYLLWFEGDEPAEPVCAPATGCCSRLRPPRPQVMVLPLTAQPSWVQVSLLPPLHPPPTLPPISSLPPHCPTDPLKSWSCLSQLSLAGCRSAHPLPPFIAPHYFLQCSFSCCRMRDSGLQCLPSVLPTLSSLTLLDLSRDISSAVAESQTYNQCFPFQF